MKTKLHKGSILHEDKLVREKNCSKTILHQRSIINESKKKKL